jgi:glycosyltransferase involved in cell wall biosynthesis
VDDNSSDLSAKVAASYGDNRFHIIRNDSHIGLTKSLNKAISLVKTPFTARHDSDDFSDRFRLSKQIDFLNSNPKISVVGSFVRVYNPSFVPYDTQDKPVTHLEIAAQMSKDNPMNHGSVVMRSDILNLVNGYDESFFIFQDYALWSKILFAGGRFHNIPEYLYNRISHQKCASKTYREFRKTSMARIRKMHKKK